MYNSCRNTAKTSHVQLTLSNTVGCIYTYISIMIPLIDQSGAMMMCRAPSVISVYDEDTSYALQSMRLCIALQGSTTWYTPSHGICVQTTLQGIVLWHVLSSVVCK